MTDYQRIAVKPHNWRESHRLFSQAINFLLDRIDYTYVNASAIVDNIGAQTPVGSLANTTIALDGSFYNMPENNSSPAIDVDFDFTNVTRIRGIVFNARYTGSSTHYMIVRIRDYVGATDRDLMHLTTTPSNNYRTILIPDDTRFIDANGNAQISFYHPTSGNTSHDLFVDYIALLQ